ncbi:MAG: GNAT family N-acetyltransferase [Dehalococcoidia bacterium]
MSEVTFGSTADASLEAICRALTGCYRGFGERMNALARAAGVSWPEPEPDAAFPVEEEAEFLRVQNIDLAHSVLARQVDGGAIVGIALLGRRGVRGWLGEFAVAPEWRGRGIADRLLEAFLAEARSIGVRHVEFDVLAVNTPAIRVYERGGFRRAGDLLELIALAGDLGPGAGEPPAGMRASPCPVGRVAGWFAETMAGEPTPCWERDLPALLARSNAQAVVASQGGEEEGLLVYVAEPATAGRPRARVQVLHAGLRSTAGTLHLRALLGAAAREAGFDPGAAAFRAGLEPAGGRLARELRAAGFREGRRSYDMRRDI